MLSPGTNPGNNLVQGVQGESDLQLPVGKFLDPLGIVPGSLPHQLSSERVKLQGYFIRFIIFTLPDLEAVLEKLLEGFGGGFLKRAPGWLDLAHPGENEYASGVALEVVPEEIPLATDTGQVPRFDGAFLVVPGTQLFVFKLNRSRLADRLREGVKRGGVWQICVKLVEGKRGIDVGPTDTQFRGSGGGKFGKRVPQGLFEGGAFVRGQGFLSNEQGDQFALGEFEQRQFVDRFRKIVTAAAIIELDSKAELMPHVVEVPLDGLGGDFDVRRELGSIGVTPGLDGMKDFSEPIQWSPGSQCSDLIPPGVGAGCCFQSIQNPLFPGLLELLLPYPRHDSLCYQKSNAYREAIFTPKKGRAARPRGKTMLMQIAKTARYVFVSRTLSHGAGP